MIKWYRLATLIFIFLLACSCRQSDTFTADQAVRKVVEEKDVRFPVHVGKRNGVIQGGGPAPGLQIPGEFETKVKRIEANKYLVTLTETWNRADFNKSGADSIGSRLHHYWVYEVTVEEVQLVEEGGDFAPDQMG